MSSFDKKKRNVTEKGAKNFSLALEQVFDSLDELRKEVGGLTTYEQLHEAHSTLRRNLDEKEVELYNKEVEKDRICKEKDAEVSMLKEQLQKIDRDKETLLRTFEERYSTWEADSRHHSASTGEILGLKKTLSELTNRYEIAARENTQRRNALEFTSSELGDCKRSLETKSNELQIKSLSLKNAETHIQEYQQKLASVTKELGLAPVNHKHMTKRIEYLSLKVKKIVWTFFDTDLLSPADQIKPPSARLSKIPQMTSSTKPARLLRCAFAEATVAWELTRTIFKSVNIPLTAAVDSSGLITTLNWLNRAHPRQASIIRGQLVAASEEYRDDDAAAQQASKHVCDILSPWLGDKATDFTSQLSDAFREALLLWRILERGPEQAIAATGLSYESWLASEDSRHEYDDVEVAPQHQAQKATSELIPPIAVLFPQIYLGEHILFHGFALYPTQHCVIAAKLEASDQNPRGVESIRRLRRSQRENDNMVNCTDAENLTKRSQ